MHELLEFLRRIPGAKHRRVVRTRVGGQMTEAQDSLGDQLEVTFLLDETLTGATVMQHYTASCGHLVKGPEELAGVCALCGAFLCHRPECARVCTGCSNLFCGAHLRRAIGSGEDMLCPDCRRRQLISALLGFW